MAKNVYLISMMGHEWIDVLKDFHYEILHTMFSMYSTNQHQMDVQLNWK